MDDLTQAKWDNTFSSSPSLLIQIRDHFNLLEIRDMCFNLNVDFDEFSLNLGKSGILIEFIKLLSKQNRLSELLDYLKAERDMVEWPDARFINTDQLISKAAIPLQKYEPALKFVSAGKFLMGSDANRGNHAHESPQHEVYLPDYMIGEFPVTTEEYSAFLIDAKYPKPSRGWLSTSPPRGKEKHPVVNVSWLDANSYCEWLAKKTGRPYRLPTEAEWEKAARGILGDIYPWGNTWKDGVCNNSQKSTTPINTYLEGVSPFNCQDMVGNIQEWTHTLWGLDAEIPRYRYPYDVGDGREATANESDGYRIIRSSSFKDQIANFRCAKRRWYSPDNGNNKRGFRVVIARLNNYG